MDSSIAVLITAVFCTGFGAFFTWVLMKKPNVKPPVGGSGSLDGSNNDKLNKREK